MGLRVVIKKKIRFGLEVHECHVNGVKATEFLSVQMARTWAQKFIQTRAGKSS
jgi:hypothetical protein